jgi:hypothetical protein
MMATFFPLLKPVIAGIEGIVLFGFAVAIPPLVILGAGKLNPADQDSGLISVRVEKATSGFRFAMLLTWPDCMLRRPLQTVS